MSLRPITTACGPAIGNAGALQQLDDAGRRARRQRRAVLHQPSDVDRMKAVHILGGVDDVEDRLLRARPSPPAAAILHEDAVVGRRSRSASLTASSDSLA